MNRETLRRLAELRVEDGRVLSIYLNLDPAGFATGAARSSAIRSVLDDASRRVREINGDLSHDARVALRDDVARVGDYLKRADMSGTRGLAVFASGPAELFETLRLPRPVENEVVVGTSPFVEPLVGLGGPDQWCVLLSNRREARVLRGSAEGLTEVLRVSDDVHGQHDQGGWSQARYQRSVDNEFHHHLRRSAEALHRHFRRRPFDHLVLGAPEETYARLEKELHADVRRRLRARVEIDVENTNPTQVLEAARPLIESYERERQDELLGRLRQGLGKGGRAVAGLDGVLGALNEQRVEALLLESGFSAPGVECPRCGWLGAEASQPECPADGAELERRSEIVEPAVERALTQDAEVLPLRDRPELGPHGRIAALLRF